mgnify:CR=1 FL=1
MEFIAPSLNYAQLAPILIVLGGALAGAACGVFVLAPAQWRLPRWTEFVMPMAIGVVAAAIAVTPSL